MITTFKPNKKLSMNIKDSDIKELQTRANLYNATQVAELTGFSISTIIKDMRSGKLKWLERGKTKYATKKSLHEYLTED
jgi:hypothetical protein